MSVSVITNGFKEFLTRKCSGEDISIDTIWGEYGAYTPGESPVFTPLITDTIDDLLPDKESFSVYSISNNNPMKVIGFINNGDGRVYAGAALAADNGQLVIARSAFVTKEKEENVDIGLSWNINFGVNE